MCPGHTEVAAQIINCAPRHFMWSNQAHTRSPHRLEGIVAIVLAALAIRNDKDRTHRLTSGGALARKPRRFAISDRQESWANSGLAAKPAAPGPATCPCA